LPSALEEVLSKYGAPAIFTPDQGRQIYPLRIYKRYCRPRGYAFSMISTPLISMRDLRKSFASGRGRLDRHGSVRAVRGVSIDIAPGETLGVVGESGCGKSTLGRMLVGLLEPDAGEVLVKGAPLYDRSAHADYAAFRRGLACVVQMILQDPPSSLNPRMRIGESIAEPLRCSSAWLAGKPASPGRVRERVSLMLQQVGLDDDAARRYPHEFSGGQRQRVAIARALVTRPAFVVCDEPTSSLDASVQSQVLNLLRDMQEELGLTYCFISHDLAVVRHMSDHVAVMYQGLLVEEGDAESLFSAPCHPYTRLLLDSVDGRAASTGSGIETGREGALPPDGKKDLAGVGADGRGKGQEPEGCAFLPRCPLAMPECADEVPELLAVREIPGRRARCRLLPA
jgi:oligopeptide/dipeptide ABC transporter ATP-binding protein